MMKKAETKYETGDKVWMIKSFKAVQFSVREATITIKNSKIEVGYRLNLLEGGDSDYETYLEANIYPSKEELIKNL